MKNKRLIFIAAAIAAVCLILLPISSSLSDIFSGGKTMFYGKENNGSYSDVYIFYSMLPDEDKAVYRLFQDLVEHREKSEYENVLYVDRVIYNELTLDHFFNIYYAMCYDHPEYFFLLTGASPRIQAFTDDEGMYKKLRFFLSEGSTYESEMSKELDCSVTDFLSEIDLTLPQKDVELLIHDKLIDLVQYDYKLYENDISENYNLSSTAYGALVRNDNNEPHTALCGGYALAFELLCQRAGIPCGYITGMADPNTESAENFSFHAWNIVYIDESYYETDITWDDIDIYKKIRDENLIKRLQEDDSTMFDITHHYYNLSTKEMENLKRDSSNDVIIAGYKPFVLRASSSHLRGTYKLYKTDNISMYLNSLLPVAK